MTVRKLELTGVTFVRGPDVSAETINSVEEGPMGGLVTVKVLMATESMVMLESYRAAGVIDPWHKHDDHETVCYLTKGALPVSIGDETFTAKPGDTWFHPKGVLHRAEAIEESVQVEVKAPPRKTWI